MAETTFTPNRSPVQKEALLTSKNFGLTKEQFSLLAEGLQNGNEQLFEQIFLVHFQEALRLLQKKYRASPEDAYDAVMETLIRFRLKIMQEKIRYGNLRFLFFQMCSQTYLKSKERNERLLLYMDQQRKASQQQEDDRLLTILEKALEQLGEECRELLKKFYYNGVTLRSLAHSRNLSETAIRKQKQRCKDRLKMLVLKITHHY